MVDHNKEKYEDDIIYRLRPRFNEQVNGYFMCDRGRMAYKSENDGRLETHRLGNEIKPLQAVVDEIKRRMARAENILFLVSPSASLEQLAAVKALAGEVGAVLSAFSDGYIVEGSGDDFLSRDDKAANRAGVDLLGIAKSRSHFQTAAKKAEVFINFNNDLARSLESDIIDNDLDNAWVVNLATRPGLLGGGRVEEKAAATIALRSWSEYHGVLINFEHIAQKFVGGVTKNIERPDLVDVAAALGSPAADTAAAWVLVQREIPDLMKFGSFIELPAEGVKLDSEAGK